MRKDKQTTFYFAKNEDDAFVEYRIDHNVSTEEYFIVKINGSEQMLSSEELQGSAIYFSIEETFGKNCSEIPGEGKTVQNRYVDVNLLDNARITFSKLQYIEGAKIKTQSIGRVDITTMDMKSFKESIESELHINVSKYKEDSKKEFFEKTFEGTLKKVEAVTDDFKAEIQYNETMK